jgi:Ycf4
LFIRIKGRREIPLTRVGEPISLTEIETQGAELARFLSIPLEGL